MPSGNPFQNLAKKGYVKKDCRASLLWANKENNDFKYLVLILKNILILNNNF
jgi:hypothetical protein